MMETIEAPPRDRPLTDAELWRRLREAEAERMARLPSWHRSTVREPSDHAGQVVMPLTEPERVSLSAIARSRSPWDAVKLAELPNESAAAIRFAVKGGGVVTVQPLRHDFDAEAIRNPNAMLASLITAKRDWGGVCHVWGDIGFQHSMVEMSQLVGVRVVPSPDFQTRAYNQQPQLAERSAAMLAAVKAKTPGLG